MIAIPNIGNPQNCAECPISALSEFSGIVCKLNRNNNKSNCPLIDIVTCGECICYRGDHNYCANDYFARENGFCSYGERRSE